MDEGVKKKSITVKFMLLKFFSKLKAYAHILVETWLKELRALTG